MPTRTENGIKRKRTAYLKAMRAYDEKRGPMPHWGDYLVRPIAEALGSHLGPGYEVEVGTPMGLGARVSVTITQREGPVDSRGKPPSAWFCFEPGQLSAGEIRLVDFSRIEHDYPPGSIGRINGLQHPSDPRPVLLDLLSRARKQLAEARDDAEGA